MYHNIVSVYLDAHFLIYYLTLCNNIRKSAFFKKKIYFFKEKQPTFALYKFIF